MTRPVAVLLGLSLLVAPACGRKGALVLPPGRAPMPVESLTAEIGEGQVVLRWTNPTKEISGKPLGSLRKIEIWVFDKGLPEGEISLSSERIERTARLARTIQGRDLAALAAGEGTPGRVAFAYPLPPAGAPERLAFAVRVIDSRRHASEFAGPVAVEIAKKDGGVDRPPVEGVS